MDRRETLPVPLQFQRGGLFYPYVSTFIAASAGLTAVFDAQHYPRFLRHVTGVFPGIVVFGNAETDLGARVQAIRNGEITQAVTDSALCCMLANTCYSQLRGKQLAKVLKSPVGRLFKHVRHAASHGNVWSFEHDQPKGTAVWRTFSLDHARTGKNNPLFGKQCFGSTLRAGDLLWLLCDVETLLEGS